MSGQDRDSGHGVPGAPKCTLIAAVESRAPNRNRVRFEVVNDLLAWSDGVKEHEVGVAGIGPLDGERFRRTSHMMIVRRVIPLRGVVLHAQVEKSIHLRTMR